MPWEDSCAGLIVRDRQASGRTDPGANSFRHADYDSRANAVCALLTVQHRRFYLPVCWIRHRQGTRDDGRVVGIEGNRRAVSADHCGDAAASHLY